MGCFERFLIWLSIDSIPENEKSILRDLMKIGIIES